MSQTEATPAPFQRRVPFEGIYNFRDLGGYPTRYGRATRARSVYRSSSLNGATGADREHLARLGIARIFDLRSFREVERDGFLDLAGLECEREHTPVFPDTDASPEGLVARYRLYSEDFATVYLMMLRDGAPSYRRVLAALAADRRPLVYHCSGGKDRAGTLSAVLLLLAGVDHATVVADYALTTEFQPPPNIERLDKLGEILGLSREELLAMHHAAPDSMSRTLERFTHTYGTAEDYLASIGVDEATIERARARLLADEPGDA